jgi:hypothetical protein
VESRNQDEDRRVGHHEQSDHQPDGADKFHGLPLIDVEASSTGISQERQ